MSDYVMVPVPEDLADDVRRFVQWKTTQPERPSLDEATIARAAKNLDASCRTLLTLVADATAEGGGVTIAHIASLLRCSAREVLGTTLHVNHFMWVGGAGVALIPQKLPGVPHDSLDERIITMDGGVARVVIAALRRDVTGNADIAGN